MKSKMIDLFTMSVRFGAPGNDNRYNQSTMIFVINEYFFILSIALIIINCVLVSREKLKLLRSW